MKGPRVKPRRLSPPADLPADEAALFREIISNTAPDHFVPSDLPLLISYVQSTRLSRRAAVALHKDASLITVWEKATRMQATLATRLRLAPQSRVDPKTLARRTADVRPSAYDLMGLDDD
jgi:hypothetical protein